MIIQEGGVKYERMFTFDTFIEAILQMAHLENVSLNFSNSTLANYFNFLQSPPPLWFIVTSIIESDMVLNLSRFFLMSKIFWIAF